MLYWQIIDVNISPKIAASDCRPAALIKNLLDLLISLHETNYFEQMKRRLMQWTSNNLQSHEAEVRNQYYNKYSCFTAIIQYSSKQNDVGLSIYTQDDSVCLQSAYIHGNSAELDNQHDVQSE